MNKPWIMRSLGERLSDGLPADEWNNFRHYAGKNWNVVGHDHGWQPVINGAPWDVWFGDLAKARAYVTVIFWGASA